MDEIIMMTPRNKLQHSRLDRTRRFVRKPMERSERSSSKRSIDNSVKEMYIKTPASPSRAKDTQTDFFTTLASSLISKETADTRRQDRGHQQTVKKKENYYSNKPQVNVQKIRTLEAQVELKNHQIVVISGEVQRLKNLVEQERLKRKKVENDRKQISRELKEIVKSFDLTQVQLKKSNKQKEHLLKQIQFLEKINYDEKTRSLQSYRQNYLQTEIERLKNQIKKSKGQKQLEFQKQYGVLKQQKFTAESHYKAMKVANECLIKQITQVQQNLHEIIINSVEYKTLRDKYVHFLQQYKQLRNQYWALKAETNQQNKDYSSDLFSISISEVENDLSLLKALPAQSILNFQNQQPEVPKPKLSQKKKFETENYEPTYSFT